MQAATGQSGADDLFNSRFLGAVSQLSPALVVKWMLPGFFGGNHQVSYTIASAGDVVFDKCPDCFKHIFR